MRTNLHDGNIKSLVSLHSHTDIYIVIPIFARKKTVLIYIANFNHRSRLALYIPLTDECSHWSMNCCTEELSEEPKQQPEMKLPGHRSPFKKTSLIHPVYYVHPSFRKKKDVETVVKRPKHQYHSDIDFFRWHSKS